ncbi:MAG: DUF748 domain-containing protein [bacterium]
MSRKLFVSVLITIVLLTLLTLISVGTVRMYLENQVQHYGTQYFGDSFGLRSVKLNIFAHKITLRGVKFKSTAQGYTASVSISELAISPDLTSFLSDTIVINTVAISDPDVQLTSPDTGTSKKKSPSTKLAPAELPATSGGVSNSFQSFRLDTFRLDHGTVDWMIASVRGDTELRLNEIEVKTGIVTPRTLKEGIDIDARATVAGGTGQVTTSLDVSVLPELQGSGLLKISGLGLASFNQFMGNRVELRSGTLTTLIPFSVSRDHLHLRKTDIRVQGLRAEVLRPPEVTPDTRPLDQNPPGMDTEVAVPEDTGTNFQFGADRFRLELLDSTLEFPTGDTVSILKLSRATFLSGSLSGWNDPLSLKSQLVFQNPAGLIEFKGTLLLPVGLTGITNLIARMRIEQVSQLNQYLSSVLPVVLKRGQMELGARGHITSNKLDLAVEVNFRDLKTGSGTGSGSKVIGIPLNQFLRYLQKNNGNLDLNFTVKGTPVRPIVDTSWIRTRILVNLGVDAAVIGSIGAPVYVGDKILEKLSGLSLLGSAKNALGSVFQGEGEKNGSFFEPGELSLDGSDTNSVLKKQK